MTVSNSTLLSLINNLADALEAGEVTGLQLGEAINEAGAYLAEHHREEYGWSAFIWEETFLSFQAQDGPGIQSGIEAMTSLLFELHTPNQGAEENPPVGTPVYSSWEALHRAEPVRGYRRVLTDKAARDLVYLGEFVVLPSGEEEHPNVDDPSSWAWVDQTLSESKEEFALRVEELTGVALSDMDSYNGWPEDPIVAKRGDTCVVYIGGSDAETGEWTDAGSIMAYLVVNIE